MTISKKYQYITIEQVAGELFAKHPVYRIFNNKSGEQLAILSYYRPWKRYVFSSRVECVFTRSCLIDIIDFIDNVAIEAT